MGLYPITINTPLGTLGHIYSEDDAAIYQSIIGEDCVFDIGNKFKTQTLSSNKIRLSDGVLQVGGHVARIKHGDYEDVTINNGVSGKKRVDIIVCRFSVKSIVSDTMEIVAIQGTPGDTYTDPAINEGDLYEGASVREMPLYRVKLDGINIVAVEQLFTVRKSLKGMAGTLTTFPSGDITQILELENGYIKIMGKVSSSTMGEDTQSKGYLKQIDLKSQNIDLDKPYVLSTVGSSRTARPEAGICFSSLTPTTLLVMGATNNDNQYIYWSIEGQKKTN